MDIFSLVILEFGNYTVTFLQLLLAIISILSCIIMIILLRIFFKKRFIQASFGEKNARMIKKFLFSIFVFFGLYALLESVGIDFSYFLNKSIIKSENFTFLVYHIIVFYIIIVGTKVLLSIIETLINVKEQASQIERGKTKNIYQILQYFIYLIAIAIFVQSLGINITILIAGLSALLLGLGLGIQHLFNDIVSGIILLFDRSIKIGDVIEIKDELVGKVEKINLRTSTLVTRDDIEVIIPNSKFTADNIINWTYNKVQTRFFIKVGVAYGSDVRLVEKILTEIAKDHKDISDNPEPKVMFVDFGNSSLDFKLLFYSEVTFRIETIKSELRFEIDKKFRENKIRIPYPQRDVHLYTQSK